MRPAIPMLSVKLVLAVTIVLTYAASGRGAPSQSKHTKMPGAIKAFMRAAYEGNLRKMQVLLSEGTKMTATDENGENALVWAVNGGQARIVNFLLNSGVTAKDKNGNEALFTAVDEGQTSIVNALLRHGANVNARDSDGATPLMIACFYDPGEDDAYGQSADIVRILLAHKADVSERDNHGRTTLMYLKNKPNAQIRRMLLKAGAVR